MAKPPPGGGETPSTALLLGVRNTASAVTTLINNGPGAALDLQVQPGNPPLVVNSDTKVDNLNADKVDGKDATELAGQQGPQGEQGPAGPAGPPGPQGIVSTQSFTGQAQDVTVPADHSQIGWVFVGPTVNVTTTGPGQKLVGSAVGYLGSDKQLGNPDEFGLLYGLCYQSSTGGRIIPFFGGESTTMHQQELGYLPFPASQAVTPGSGTWKVGYCVTNSWNLDNQSVSGWVQVVSAQ